MMVNGHGVLRAADSIQESVKLGNTTLPFYVKPRVRDSVDVALGVFVVFTTIATVTSVFVIVSAEVVDHFRR